MLDPKHWNVNKYRKDVLMLRSHHPHYHIYTDLLRLLQPIPALESISVKLARPQLFWNLSKLDTSKISDPSFSK